MSRLGDMGLSGPQLAAVTDPRPQVLVAAGAGSGKTRLLVAAVVKALVEEGLPAEKLVAVTFTRKAGAELAGRVRETLDECGRSDLARSLDSAMIGTIDALCLRLLRDRALAAGVDPSCAILEPGVSGLMKEEVMRRVWETAVEQADDRQLAVLASQGRSLCKDVVLLYDHLRGLGTERPRLELPLGRSEEEACSNLRGAIEEALPAGVAQSPISRSLQEDLAKLRGCLTWLGTHAAERSSDLGLQSSAGFFPSRTTKAMQIWLEPVRARLAEYRCVLAESCLRPLAETVNVLLDEFHIRYARHKQERGLIDFADLELKARALLQGGCEDGTTAGGLPGGFLLVDEFQDTNELQWAILSRLGAARVIAVGDARQSIYRFRGADVEVMKRREAALSRDTDGGSAGGVHRLDVNYRSHPEILSFVNRLFADGSLFGQGFSPLVADPEWAATRAGRRRTRVHPGARVDVLVAARHLAEQAIRPHMPMHVSEAEVLAERVRSLRDEEGWRQRDIVVLLPTQTHVDVYQAALAARGIDVYLVRGKGYYVQEEVTDVTALLRLLVNPHEDLSLISVLRSPLAGVSDDGLYLLGKERRARGAPSLWEVLRTWGVESLEGDECAAIRRFLDHMADLRSWVGRPRLSRLIDEAVSIFSYDLCLLSAPEGRRRFANVRKLMRLAEEYETAAGPDLAGFLRLVESIGRLSDQEGNAPTLAEGEDVVRVMTVHQAKGLEFPVVVLGGLGADVHRLETSTVVVGSDGRVGLFLKGHRCRSYESHDPSWGPAVEISAEEARKEQEEDIRLLYVAMTRAEERLVLVGARPGNDSLDGSRVGMIVRALGLDHFPENGERVSVEGLSCVVAGVEPSLGGATLEPDRVPRARTETVRKYRKPAATTTKEDAGGPGREAPPRFLEPTPRTAVPGHLSFSTLSAYQRCPRRFYLERVLGLALGTRDHEETADEAGPADAGMLDDEEWQTGRDTGILVHRLLRDLPTVEGRPDYRMVQTAAEDWATATGVRLPREETGRAIRLTMAAWDSPVADLLSTPAVMKEAPFFFALGGTVLFGYMDLVVPDSDGWHVVDYKTNSLRGRSITDLAAEYLLQGDVYCLAALRAGADSVRMDFVFLENPSDVATVHRTAEDVPRLEDRVNDILGGLGRRDFARKTVGGCERCPVFGVCAAMAPAQTMV